MLLMRKYISLKDSDTVRISAVTDMYKISMYSNDITATTDQVSSSS